MYFYGPPHMAVQKQNDQHEHTFSRYVRIRDVALKTYLGRWTIGRSGERESGIFVLPARYDDDDDIVTHQHKDFCSYKVYPFRLSLWKTATFHAWNFIFSLSKIFTLWLILTFRVRKKYLTSAFPESVHSF